MKKLGKSLSFLTKIMLVIGLLISNLSSLSVVFASEVKIEVSVVDDKLNIEYLDELADDVKSVKVNVYENYTYLDETYYINEVTSLKGKVSSYELSFEENETLEENEIALENPQVETTEQVVENVEETITDLNTVEEENINVENENLEEEVSTENTETLEKEISLVVDTILSEVVFDGTYDVTVEIVDTTDANDETVIETQDYSMAVLHDSGLELAVVDAHTGDEIVALEDGRYPVTQTSPKVSVVAKVLSGGLKPTDVFLYEDEEYMASEILELPFYSEMDFNGRLYGEYILPVEVRLGEELVYTDSLNLLYESYEKNTLLLNTATELLELDESYEFSGNSKDGILYVLLDAEKINTMLDLYNLVNLAVGENDVISYILSNSEYSDILSTYDETTATVTLEEYLDAILLDDSVLLSLVNDGLTVTYKVVVAGDVNNDKTITEEDLLGLINQVVGEEEVNVEKSDLYELDGELNTLDVMYLDQVMKNETWNVELIEENATLDARLEVVGEDIISGDEFTVNYVLGLSDYAVNGISGLFKYDETMLELVDVKTANEWLGNSKDGKFLYVGEESLTGPVTEEIETPEVEDTVIDNANVEVVETVLEEEVEVVTQEYVVVTATFRALKSGMTTVTLENPEYFDQTKYLIVEEMALSTDVVVNASDNNNLSSLIVAGQEIVLEDDVLEYEITVGNDVTTADIEVLVENVAANITSIVSPEELVEGENTITISVTSETGDVKIYTITVIREEAPEETITKVNYDNNYNDYEEDDEDTEVVTPEIEEDEDDENTEEESNLSRIVIIILILLVIAGLIYLIFKDEDDEETKKTNKEINKLKKEVKEPEVKVEKKAEKKVDSKPNNNSKSKNSKNKKRER